MDDCRLYDGIHQERGGARNGEGRGEGGERRVDNVLA